jgi:hypothetical protein
MNNAESQAASASRPTILMIDDDIGLTDLVRENLADTDSRSMQSIPASKVWSNFKKVPMLWSFWTSCCP